MTQFFLLRMIQCVTAHGMFDCACLCRAEELPPPAVADDDAGGPAAAAPASGPQFRLSVAAERALREPGVARPAADRQPLPTDVDDKRFPQEKVLPGLRGLKISLADLFASFCPRLSAADRERDVPRADPVAYAGDGAVVAPPVKRAKKAAANLAPVPVVDSEGDEVGDFAPPPSTVREPAKRVSKYNKRFDGYF